MNQPPTKRLSYLDSSRGLAALAVLLSHFQLTILPQLNDSWLLKTPLHLFFDGTSAILYFFILSGYVLTLSIQNSEQLSIFSYIKFITLRIFRIFPAFIVTLLITYLTIHFFVSRPSTWLFRYWTAPSDFYSLLKQAVLIVRFPDDPLLRLIPQDWTLTIEIAISLLLPLLSYSSQKKSLLVLIFIYCAVQFLRLDPFVFDFSIGIYIACNRRNLKIKWFQNKYKIPLLLIALGLICTDFAFPHVMAVTDIVLIHHKSWGLAIFLWAIISSTKTQRLLSLKPLIFLGKISYSFYLQHLIILFIMTVLFLTLSTITFLLVYLLITILVSSITYYRIEKPFNKIARFLINK